MRFSGRLGAFGLSELVCVLEQLEFQGTLRLRRAGEQALLVFAGDELFFPLPEGRSRRRMRLRAERLLKRVCAWDEVRFDTLPDRVPPTHAGQFRVSHRLLEGLCRVPGRRPELGFSGALPAACLSALGLAFSARRSTGVLLVDDGAAATSVFYHAGTPFRRTSARSLRNARGEVVVRWAGGLRGELVEHPERFQKIRDGWAA
ncbi:MAG: hypothetical protein KDD82_17460 [Planctomycetes bacterium]|nr:hypothetical protein [Planctomycetota bacterium]